MKEKRKGKPKRGRQEENSYNPNRHADPEESNKNIYIRGNTPSYSQTSQPHAQTETHSRAKQLGFL